MKVEYIKIYVNGLLKWPWYKGDNALQGVCPHMIYIMSYNQCAKQQHKSFNLQDFFTFKPDWLFWSDVEIKGNNNQVKKVDYFWHYVRKLQTPSINTKKTNFSQIWSQQLTSHTLRRMCTISQPRCSVYLMWISVSHLFDCLNNTNQNIIRRHVLPFRHWLQRSSLRVENKSVVFFLTVAIAICENVQSRFSRPVSRYTFTEKMQCDLTHNGEKYV